jgi:phosphotransferase system HPr (HPr) family protein
VEYRQCMVVRCPHGLQIREAFLLARLAQQSPAEITLLHDGYQADAKSLMAILWLGVRRGGRITVTATGAEAESALASLETLLNIPRPSVFAPERSPEDGGADGQAEATAGG